MTPNVTERSNNGGMSMVSALNVLLGIWFFLTPWVFGANGNPNAWNAWIVGAFVVCLAAIRIGNPIGTRPLSWFNVVLGVWVFASPWIYGYTADTGRFVDSLCVGVAVFVLSLVSSNMVTQNAIPQH